MSYDQELADAVRELSALRAQLTAAKANAAKWANRARMFQDAYTEASTENLALRIQKLALASEGGDVVIKRQNASLKDKLLSVSCERNNLREDLRTAEAKIAQLEAQRQPQSVSEEEYEPLRCSDVDDNQRRG